jgi:hypothetical protein
MEHKIPVFSSLPESELSKVSDRPSGESEMSKLRSIESEFEKTNQHTKQAENTGNTTVNTEDTLKTGENSSGTLEASAPVKKNRLGKLMQGTFAVDLVDMLIPSLVVLLIDYIGYKLDKKDLQLTKSEKEALAPAVQDVLDDIDIDFNNPYINLAVMITIVYGSKIVDKIPTMKKKDKPTEKKGMSEAISEVLQTNGEAGEEVSDVAKFETDYGKLVDEVRLSRRRGVGDAKQYIAENYPEKIKAIAKRHGLSMQEPVVIALMKFKHVKVRRKQEGDDFKMV